MDVPWCLVFVVCALFVVFWWQVSLLWCLVALPYLLVAFGCFPMFGGGACLLVSGVSANPNSLEGGGKGR